MKPGTRISTTKVDYCIRSDGGKDLGPESSAMAGWWSDPEIAREEAKRRNSDGVLLEFTGTWRVYERTITTVENRVD